MLTKASLPRTSNSTNSSCTKCPQDGVLIQHSSCLGGKGEGKLADWILVVGSVCMFMIPGRSGQSSFMSKTSSAKIPFFLHLTDTVVQSSANTMDSWVLPVG